MGETAFAMRGAFVQHWLLIARPSDFLLSAASQGVAVAVFAWIAASGGDATVVTAVTAGVVLVVLWRAAVFHLGFLVVDANNAGTLEVELLSRTPVAALIFGKTLAAATFYGLLGALACVLALSVSGGRLAVAEPLLFALGVPVAVLSVVALAFLFAPLTFVVGGKPGFFNAISPLGIVLSGFVHPVGLLPPTVEVMARVLPTAWALESLQLALAGTAGVARIALGWTFALMLSCAVLALAAWLFAVGERRVRGAGLV